MFFRDQVVGKYRILAPLGSGGFGTVFLAEDTWIDKKVALKVPHRQALDFDELLQRAAPAGDVEPSQHRHRAHRRAASDDVFFIVMEYVPGETLEAISDREGALELAQGPRLHLPDLQRGGSRARPRGHPPRPAARQRAS